jgi:hypothetical protein
MFTSFILNYEANDTNKKHQEELDNLNEMLKQKDLLV